MLRRSSPGARTLARLPVTNSIIGTSRGFPLRGQSVQTPSRAVVREIIGPAGTDKQIFPPTVASFQILNEERNEWQHSLSNGAAFHSGGATKRSSSNTRQVAAISRPLGDTVKEGQPSASRSINVWVWTCGSENNQVPPASQAKPAPQSLTSSARTGRLISTMVFRSIVFGIGFQSLIGSGY